jgi:hypothetical protein
MGNSRIKEAEIASFLRNSPKGQLKYDNGWDQNPQAIWVSKYHLVGLDGGLGAKKKCRNAVNMLINRLIIVFAV